MNLFPFSHDPSLQVSATLKRVGNETLSARFEVLDATSSVRWPPRRAREEPSRKDGLWKQSCFELFLQPSDRAEYWEINVSSSGDWNAYRFESYREGMCEDVSIRLEKLDWGCSHELAVAEFSLRRAGGWADELAAGLTCVIEKHSGEISYWALKQRPGKPDFHWARSFILKV